MKKWEIWSEGYAITGNQAGAHFHGEIEAESFDEACIKLVGDKLDKVSDGSFRRGSYRGYVPPGANRQKIIENGGNYSIWGCQLFDNEADARKSFG